MATFINRSHYVVRVPRRAGLERTFAHGEVRSARRYSKSCGVKLTPPSIRQRGYADLNFDGGSYEDAEASAARIEAERKTGLFVDYMSGHRVNYAELIERYVQEVCPETFQRILPQYKGFFRMTRIAEAIQPLHRRVFCFHVESGLGTPRSFNSREIARLLAPSTKRANISRATAACSLSISSIVPMRAG